MIISKYINKSKSSRKAYLLLLFAILFLASCKSTANSVVCDVKNLDDKKHEVKLFVQTYIEPNQVAKGTLSDEENTLRFELPYKKPMGYILQIDDAKYIFYADSNGVQLDIDWKNRAVYETQKNEESKKYNEFAKQAERLKVDYEKSHNIILSYLNNGGKLGQTDEGIAFERNADIAEKKWKDYVREYISKTDNPAQIFMASFYLHQRDDFYFLRNLLVEKNIGKANPKLNNELKLLTDYTQNSFANIPSSSLQALDDKGQKQSISQQKKYPYYLLRFWATYCHGSQVYAQELNETIEDLDTSKIKIINISLDEDKQKWIEAIQTQKQSIGEQWIIPDGSKKEIFDNYQINGIPSSLLLDSLQNVISINLQPWEIKKVLNKK